MQAPTHNSRIASFVRGYFARLDELGIASAVLHDWQGAFENELTDVDHVIDARAFPDVARIVSEYCAESGWRMCQVLRHETTAAYCVCSAADDPGCAVALDACSDYQRNGTVLLTAGELLADRRPLPWGGFRLSETSELKYRMIKAAAKRKDAAVIGPELAGYPAVPREACETWLESRWGFRLEQWSVEGLARAFTHLHRKTCNRAGFLQPASLKRIAGRILQPTGLFAILHPGASKELSAGLRDTFGDLYFRRPSMAQGFGARTLLSIIRSTIVFSARPGPFAALCPKSCRMRVSSTDAVSASHEIADFLHRRCHRREHLPTPSPSPCH